jgi:fatty acid/phospholipid biosynthesis enzyme
MNTDELIQAAAQEQVEHYKQVALLAAVKAAREAEAAAIAVEKARAELKTSQLLLNRVQTANRPAIVLGATVQYDGDVFVASAAGVSAEGESPEIAFDNFDRLWSQGIQ